MQELLTNDTISGSLRPTAETVEPGWDNQLGSFLALHLGHRMTRQAASQLLKAGPGNWSFKKLHRIKTVSLCWFMVSWPLVTWELVAWS